MSKLQVNINGKKFSSWGTGTTKDMAAFKAIAELTKRIIFSYSSPYIYKSNNLFLTQKKSINQISHKYPESLHWLGSTTSGTAVHSTHHEAKENAINELIERHTILKALALKISPQKILGPQVAREYKIPSNISTKYFLWYGPFHKAIVLQQISFQNGFYYSFGCHQNLEKAKEKAFFEGIGLIIYSTQNHSNHLRNFNITKEDKIDLEMIKKYHKYYKDSETINIFKNAVEEKVFIDSSINRKHIFHSEYCMPYFMRNLSPIKAVKTISPILQPLFFNWWKKEFINPVAISIEEEKLPRGLHVIA